MVRCNVGVEMPEGCHLSDHTIGLRSVEDREVYNILMAHRKLICQPHTRKKYFFLGKKFPLLKDLVSVECGGWSLYRVTSRSQCRAPSPRWIPSRRVGTGRRRSGTFSVLIQPDESGQTVSGGKLLVLFRSRSRCLISWSQDEARTSKVKTVDQRGSKEKTRFEVFISDFSNSEEAEGQN